MARVSDQIRGNCKHTKCDIANHLKSASSEKALKIPQRWREIFMDDQISLRGGGFDAKRIWEVNIHVDPNIKGVL